MEKLCILQAWASGTPFLLFDALSGIKIAENHIFFKNPRLPEFIDELYVYNLNTSKDVIKDLCFRRYQNDETIEVLKKNQNIKIIIEKE
ncbi:MAG: hypothetical protein KatS3mg129_2790 [Leptospiraceae bacterium]|nr:MAG: hypothetical protein KatS3mg129_2790 [Leptospiraceae bacterium]